MGTNPIVFTNWLLAEGTEGLPTLAAKAIFHIEWLAASGANGRSLHTPSSLTHQPRILWHFGRLLLVEDQPTMGADDRCFWYFFLATGAGQHKFRPAVVADDRFGV